MDAGALVAQWRKLTDAMQAWTAEHGARPLNGVIIHEQDLDGALSPPADSDLARALMPRCTAGQLRGWTADGDIEPYLPAFSRLGSLARRVLPSNDRHLEAHGHEH